MLRNYLLRKVSDIQTGDTSRTSAAIKPGWAMGPFYPTDELAFARDFEVKEWNATLVRKTWDDHLVNGPEYISVTHGTLTIIGGERIRDADPPVETERVDVAAGSAVVLRPGYWRRFECTPDVTGVSVRGPGQKYAEGPEMAEDCGAADTTRKHRLEYWTKRLDHTLAHTQSSSKLIYLVDGAVLALLAFVVDKLHPATLGTLFFSVPILFLALLNYYHAILIRRQHDWYVAIDERLRETLENERPLNLPQSALGGTHDVYRRMHLVIAVALGLSAVGIACYALISRVP